MHPSKAISGPRHPGSVSAPGVYGSNANEAPISQGIIKYEIKQESYGQLPERLNDSWVKCPDTKTNQTSPAVQEFWWQFHNGLLSGTSGCQNMLNRVGSRSQYVFQKDLNGHLGYYNSQYAEVMNHNAAMADASFSLSADYGGAAFDSLAAHSHEVYGQELPDYMTGWVAADTSSHRQLQTTANASYTKMGLAAHDFFDGVGFQASHVLGGLVTGEIKSLLYFF